MSYWLRWLAVLPAAVGAYLGVQLAISFCRGLEDGFSHNPDYWCQFINSVAGPYCLVLAGAKTAPRHQFITSLVLAIVYATLIVAVVTLFLVQVQNAYQSTAFWWLLICETAGIIAAIGVCLQLRDEEGEISEFKNYSYKSASSPAS